MYATNSTPGAQARSGVAVDVYHVWWDPKLKAQIERAKKERLLAFHVCDWLTPTTDLLNDRGMMGDGVIDIPQHPRLDGGMRVRRLQRGRDLLDRQLVAAGLRRGAGYLHPAAPQRSLNADQPATERTAATAGRLAVPNSISPDSWPPSSMTTLP